MGSSASTHWKKIKKTLWPNRWLFYLATMAILAGLALSIVSWLHLCSSTCNEGHNYRLYGFTFETVGFVFFPALAILHVLSRWFPLFNTLAGWALCASLGSEIMFIYVQKYNIGSWCPVCLSIAGSLAVAGGIYFYSYYVRFKHSIEREQREDIMNSIYKGISGMCFFVIGFALAFGGMGKYNKLQAMENDIKNRIAFGNLNSSIEVYVFTDWACGGCRAIEPTIESLAPKIMKKARLIFVDQEVHPATLNYIPYNLSFMINNKPKYLELRHALTALSIKTKEPTDELVEALAAKAGTKYQQLNYADVKVGSKYFEGLVKQLNVEGTPSVIIVSKDNKKGKKLEGAEEITEANIMKAIDSFSKR